MNVTIYRKTIYANMPKLQSSLLGIGHKADFLLDFHKDVTNKVEQDGHNKLGV